MQNVSSSDNRKKIIKWVLFGLIAGIVLSAILNWKDIRDGFNDGYNDSQKASMKK